MRYYLWQSISFLAFLGISITCCRLCSAGGASDRYPRHIHPPCPSNSLSFSTSTSLNSVPTPTTDTTNSIIKTVPLFCFSVATQTHTHTHTHRLRHSLTTLQCYRWMPPLSLERCQRQLVNSLPGTVLHSVCVCMCVWQCLCVYACRNSSEIA